MRSTGVQWPEKMNLKIACSLFLLCALLGAPLGAEKQLSDDNIYDLVKRRLANDPVVKGGALDVDVKQGVVTLRGSVETEKQRGKAEKLVKKVSGVRSVNNELRVARREPR